MSAREADDRTLRQYLLGTLPEEECMRIEAEALRDDGRFEELLALEDDLLHEYAQGGLSDVEGRQLEARFLATPEGRQRLEAAHALLGRLGSPAPRVRRPPLVNVRWLAAAAALLVAAGTAWLGWRASQARVREASGASPAPSAAPAPLPSASPTAGPARVIVLALAPGLVRGEGGPRRVTLPTDAGTLRVVLTLPAATVRSWLSAALISAEGAPVWTGRVTAPDRAPTVTVDLPARQIPEGDYELVLRRAGPRETVEIAAYPFTVLRD